jgi:hypothetical protein
MAMIRIFAVVAGLALVAGASAATGHDYPGKAQGLAPTAKEIAFNSVVAFGRANKPAAGEARGFKEGVAAFYQKGTQKSPIQAVTTIYVYKSAAYAKRAYTNACAKCPTHTVYRGISMKSGSATSSGATTLSFVATCRNVYVGVAIGGEKLRALDNDAGFIVGWVFKRATGMGMSACSQ